MLPTSTSAITLPPCALACCFRSLPAQRGGNPHVTLQLEAGVTSMLLTWTSAITLPKSPAVLNQPLTLVK